MTMNISAEKCLEIALVKAEDGELLSGLWYIGVTLSILASIASNLGVNVQKFSMMKEMKKCKEIEGYEEKAYIKQKLWLVGLLLVIFGAVGDFVALGFAAQTLATPVGGFTMICNILFGHFWLKESLSCCDLFATFLILIGVILVAVSADKAEKQYTLDCLLQLYKKPSFIIYVVVILALLVSLYVATSRFGKLREDPSKSKIYSKWKRFHPICPAALSGLIGSQSVLFAKCTAEMFKSTFAGDNQFQNWEMYVIIICMIATILNQLHWLAHGLRYFDAILIVPIFQCFFITGGVVGGAVFFDEFRGLQKWEIMIFGGGVIVLVLGVFLLSRREINDHVFDGSAKVLPENSIESELKFRIRSRNNSTTDDSIDKSENDPLEESIRSIGGVERPPTPMPMSLQFHSLAMSDLYNAIREGLSTPERNSRGRKRQNKKKQDLGKGKMKNVPENEMVVLPVEDGITNHIQDAHNYAKATFSSKQRRSKSQDKVPVKNPKSAWK